MVRITAPHADLVVARDEAHGKRRQTGQQQGSDQCRLAPDPIAVMAEDRRTDRTRDKADRVDAERLQGSDQRVGFREVQFAKNQCGHLPIEQKIVRLDYRTDRAGDHGAAQLHPLVKFGPALACVFRGSHGGISL
jgi:hypothetical protein